MRHHLLIVTFCTAFGAFAHAADAPPPLPVQLAQAQPLVPRTAALEARVQQLEEDLRRLTGRIEELEHAQRQMAATRPGTSPEPTTAAPPAPAPTRLAAPEQPAPPPTPPTVAVEPDAAARQGYVLGTLPQGALRDRPTPAPTGDRYQAGLDQLQAARWAEAEQSFAAFVQENPDDPRTPTASYWLGETYLLRKDYPTAAAVFARNYRTYGDAAPRAADNLLKLGVSLAAMGDRERACQSFAELAKRHPNAPAPIKQALSRERSAAGCG